MTNLPANLHVDVHHTKFSVNWTEGDYRFHFWINPDKWEETIYKNPIAVNTRFNDTKRLDATNKTWAPLIALIKTWAYGGTINAFDYATARAEAEAENKERDRQRTALANLRARLHRIATALNVPELATAADRATLAELEALL